MTEVLTRHPRGETTLSDLIPDTPYKILHTLHRLGTGEPFTERIDLGPRLVACLSDVTDSPLSNNVLTDGNLSDDVLLDLRKFFTRHRREKTLALTVPVGPQTAELRQRLPGMGYVIGWRDVYLRAGKELLADPGKLVATASPAYAREVKTDADLDTYLAVHESAWLSELEGSYDDALLNQEGRAARAGMERLLGSGGGHGFIVERDSGGVKEPVAVGAVAVWGMVAYISRLATAPRHRGNQYAGVALASALEASSGAYYAADRLGVDPVVCLATAAKRVPYFEHRGFDYDFTVEGHVLT